MATKQQSKIRVCFVGLWTYSVFNQSTQYRFGGAEVRSSLLSKGLAQDNQFDIMYLVNNDGQPSEEIFHNVKVIPHSRNAYPRWYKRIRAALREKKQVSVEKRIKLALYRMYSITFKTLLDYLIHPKLKVYNHTILYNRFQRYLEVDADVYITITVSDIAAEIAAFCNQYNKKFILIIGVDPDLSEDYRPDSREQNIYSSYHDMCYYSIMQADHISTQTNYQTQLLKERFGRSSTVITNPIDLQNYFEKIPYPEREMALWVGKSDINKQPEVLIQLARQFPTIQFVMIMNRFDDIRSQHIIDSAPDNVVIHEFVSYNEIESFFSKAFIFISTSVNEGFPNTFLQAAKYRVPILTYNFDPDDFIQTYECGIVAHGDFGVLANGLKSIHEDKQVAMKYSENVYQYVEAHHSLQQKVDQLASIIKDCLDE